MRPLSQKALAPLNPGQHYRAGVAADHYARVCQSMPQLVVPFHVLKRSRPHTAELSADDQADRYQSADRNAYSDVRACWHDKNGAEKKSVLIGTE